MLMFSQFKSSLTSSMSFFSTAKCNGALLKKIELNFMKNISS